MPKVSIIIPVYGVEKYIERCARSLFEQTLDDIEYLFIDDCTPDKSIEILNKVLEEYPNRKYQVLIHKMDKNSGQAKVREWGTKHATGEYIIHCDSDDYVDVDMYKVMYNKAVDADSDMIVCDYCTVKEGQISQKHCQVPNTLHDRIAQLLTGKFPSYMWNKLVKRNIYQSPDIDWPKGNMWEDMATMVQVMQKVQTVEYIDQPLYFYEIREYSIVKSMDKVSVLKKFNQIQANGEIVMNSINKELYHDEIVIFKDRIRYHLTPYILDDDVWNMYCNAYPHISFDIMFCKLIPFRVKVRNLLFNSKLLHKWAFLRFSLYAKN